MIEHRTRRRFGALPLRGGMQRLFLHAVQDVKGIQGQLAAGGTLQQFPDLLNRGTAVSFWFNAFSDKKPVPTFPENAL